jgi:hypothetical protein
MIKIKFMTMKQEPYSVIIGLIKILFSCLYIVLVYKAILSFIEGSASYKDEFFNMMIPIILIQYLIKFFMTKVMVLQQNQPQK